MTELLSCPFCGGEPKCNGHPGGIMGQIFCDGEECFGPRTTALTRQDSIVQWNTRAAPVPQCDAGSVDYFAWDWQGLLWDALGDQTKVDRVLALARERGMFDPTRLAALALSSADREAP